MEGEHSPEPIRVAPTKVERIKVFRDLQREVIAAGLCGQCGGCVSFCSAGALNALEMGDDGLPQSERFTRTNIGVAKKGKFKWTLEDSGLLGPVRLELGAEQDLVLR